MSIVYHSQGQKFFLVFLKPRKNLQTLAFHCLTRRQTSNPSHTTVNPAGYPPSLESESMDEAGLLLSF